MKIKYRIWDKLYNEWNTVRPFMGDLFTLVSSSIVKFDSERYVLQIFTGQIDRNGVEIFEGDIVKCDFYDNCYGKYNEKDLIKEVKCSLSTSIDPMSSGGPDGEDLFINVEVIGNILENKELLKNEN